MVLRFDGIPFGDGNTVSFCGLSNGGQNFWTGFATSPIVYVLLPDFLDLGLNFLKF